ncbi:hypothetical protein ANRL4_02488 [Anaerolineae bacterium]|nr:hypothetical protein ANRL4_02488 [Anaerolineae bacterium]
MTLLGDHLRVLVDGYDLTGDSNHITIHERRDMHTITALPDLVQRFTYGKRQAEMDHSGYLNPTASSSHPVLKTAGLQGVVSLLLGQNAVPVVGDPSYNLYAQQSRYTTHPQSGRYVPFTTHFATAGEPGGWGVLLAVPNTTFTNTTSGTPLNNGVPTTGGGTMVLQVVQAANSDTYTFIVEGSATGAFSGEQVTLATFTLNASVAASEQQPILGCIPQYVRWKGTRTGSAGDPVRIAVSLVRHPDASGYIQKVLDIAPDDLAGYWPLYEKNGSIAHDLSVGLHNGTYTGPSLYKGYGPGGLPSPAFDGTDDLVSVSSPPIDNRSFSIAFWIKPNRKGPPDHYQLPITLYSDWLTGQSAWCWLGDTGLLAFTIFGGSVFSAEEAITFGSWQPVVFTYDYPTGIGRLYTTQVASASMGAYTGTNPTLQMGNLGTNPTTFYTGQMAHVALWQRTLSAEQVAQYFQP